MCPFCREPFAGVERCPAHDLPLVPPHRIPRVAGGSGDEPPVPAGWAGRALVLAGAVTVLGGFLAPHFVDPVGELPGRSGLSVAVATTPVLWLVPAAGALLGSVALRGTGARSLRRARFAMLGAALVAAAAEAYVVGRVGVAGRLATESAVDVGPGVAVVFAGLALAVLGASLPLVRRRG